MRFRRCIGYVVDGLVREVFIGMGTKRDDISIDVIFGGREKIEIGRLVGR